MRLGKNEGVFPNFLSEGGSFSGIIQKVGGGIISSGFFGDYPESRRGSGFFRGYRDFFTED